MRYLFGAMLLWVMAFGGYGCLGGRVKTAPHKGEVVLSGPDAGMPHWIVNWEGTGSEELVAELKGKTAAMITLQVESMGIEEGLRDWLKKVAAVCPRIYIRYNPEMELPLREHVWQMKAPKEYIHAFRMFSALCREFGAVYKVVWGPAGYPGADEYWPGEDAVDCISVTAKPVSEEKIGVYPVYASASEDIRRRVIRMRFFEKDVLVLNGSSNRVEKTTLDSVDARLRRDSALLYGTALNKAGDTGIQMPATTLKIGVFDPGLNLARLQAVSVEHLFADWKSIKNGTFDKEFQGVLKRGNEVIVTVEPWKDVNLEYDSDVLEKVVNGSYDATLALLWRTINASPKKVYLRWAHEMEIPIARYPWQSNDPVLYIKAFRYFMRFPQQRSGKVCRVWGPAGDRGSLEWWPGNDVVDYISVAIYGLPDKNITDHNKQEPFAEIMSRKLYRMRLVDKPVFITEFGVKGPDSFKRFWLKNAAEAIRKNTGVMGVCYFNMTDSPDVWGDIDAPDWSVKKETFQYFTALLQR
ncbi:MAG: hypothetical protein ACO1NW_04045 [Chitinophagaceae bacterium]